MGRQWTEADQERAQSLTTLDRMLEYAGREYVRHEKPVAAQLCLLARIAAAHDMTTAPMTEHDAKEG